MDTSVGTKARKKQPSKQSAPPVPALAEDHHLKTSLLALENACMRILESEYDEGRRDSERQYWQQRLMNLTKPVSLALVESNGPRHFHQHYRHRKDDETILHPVLENPFDTLAQVCQEALKTCRDEMVGIQDESLLKARNMLENALQGFLVKYNNGKGN